MYPFVHGNGSFDFCQRDTFGCWWILGILAGTLGSCWVMSERESVLVKVGYVSSKRENSSAAFKIVAISSNAFYTSLITLALIVLVEIGCCRILTMSWAACFKKAWVGTCGISMKCGMKVIVLIGLSDLVDGK